MRKTIFHSIYLLLFTVLFGTVGTVNAQKPYRVSDRQIQYLLNRIETRTDTFKRDLDRALDSSRLDGSDTEDMINEYVKDFESSTDALKHKFDDKDSVSGDVEDVLNRASYINSFLMRNRLSTTAQRDWTYIRTDLNTLARYYTVSWNWRNPVQTPVGRRPYRVNDTQVQALLSSIETKTDTFKRTVNRSLDRSQINNTNSEDDINSFITEFENSTDRLKQRFDARESVAADVETVLMKAGAINGFLRDFQLNRNVQNQWDSLRTDLNTLSNYYSVSWNWDRTNYPTTPTTPTGRLPYTVNDRQVQSLLSSIESRTDIYKRDMATALDRSTLNNTRSEVAANNYITEFENATDRLKQNFDARKSTTNDVSEVLNRAGYIDSFMRDYRFDTRAEQQWNLIKTDLNTLSNYYTVSWNWDRQFEPMSRFDSMLSGTYRLNVNESDNVSEVVGRVTNAYYTGTNSDRLRTNLERRLQSPDMLAIDKRGNNVTVASNTSPQITFVADGVKRSEQLPNGRRSVDITAKTQYDGIAISYEGDRINDFYVNFMPIDNNRLRVVRRVYIENRNETVTVASVYDKVNETANFSMVNNGTVGNNNNTTYTDFVVPNGTQMTAVLTNGLISTKDSKEGDRFTMEVRSPSSYDGAVIEGRVVKPENSGRVSGRANVTLDFDTIRLRNGQTYRFAGILDNVKAANGDDVKVNNEGTVRDSNQTTKTATRAGIGAALGALIGAIAGGGQGAAIGAAIGAGAGAGTVFIEGRDNIELGTGSEFMITSTAPANLSNR
ncbi:MAG: hypothetical protein ABIP06_02105 [Pyrinomonadaceae bacterium]